MKEISLKHENPEFRLLELIKKELIKHSKIFVFCTYYYNFDTLTLQGSLTVQLNDFYMRYELDQNTLIKCKTDAIARDVIKTFAEEIASKFIRALEEVEEVTENDTCNNLIEHIDKIMITGGEK